MRREKTDKPRHKRKYPNGISGGHWRRTGDNLNESNFRFPFLTTSQWRQSTTPRRLRHETDVMYKDLFDVINNDADKTSEQGARISHLVSQSFVCFHILVQMNVCCESQSIRQRTWPPGRRVSSANWLEVYRGQFQKRTNQSVHCSRKLITVSQLPIDGLMTVTTVVLSATTDCRRLTDKQIKLCNYNIIATHVLVLCKDRIKMFPKGRAFLSVRKIYDMLEFGIIFLSRGWH